MKHFTIFLLLVLYSCGLFGSPVAAIVCCGSRAAVQQPEENRKMKCCGMKQSAKKCCKKAQVVTKKTSPDHEAASVSITGKKNIPAARITPVPIACRFSFDAFQQMPYNANAPPVFPVPKLYLRNRLLLI